MLKLFQGVMPDITPAQILAGLTWVGSQLVAWGVLDQATEQHYVSITGTTLSGLIVAADILIRKHRAENADKIAALKAAPAKPAK